MDKKSNLVLRNESGAALVVALLMIIILSLIGIASSSNSTFEIRLSGNKRSATDAFYSSDAGAQSVLADIANFATTTYASITDLNSLPVELRNESIDSRFMNPSFSLPTGVNFTDPPQVTIYHTTNTKVPRGVGFSAINFEYSNYIIDSIGEDQMDLSLVRSSCQIRQKVVRIMPTMQGGY